jgi:hypothetical protein
MKMEKMMNQDYLKSWSAIANEMQKPFQAMMELNVKMLQNLTYLKPEEFSEMHKPGALLDKQVKLVMENSHKALDYMKQSFQILESAFQTISKEAKINTGKTFDSTLSTIRKITPLAMKKARSTAKKATSVVKKAASATKKTTSTAKKAASATKKAASVAKKAVSATKKATSLARRKAVSATKKATSVAKKAVSATKKKIASRAKKSAFAARKTTSTKKMVSAAKISKKVAPKTKAKKAVAPAIKKVAKKALSANKKAMSASRIPMPINKLSTPLSSVSASKSRSDMKLTMPTSKMPIFGKITTTSGEHRMLNPASGAKKPDGK